MRKLIPVLILMTALSGRAAIDPEAQRAIHDIQQGENNNNRIEILRVGRDVILPAGKIDSTEIADGSIVSADVSASAAIPVSKLSLMQIDTNATTTVTNYTPRGTSATGYLDFLKGAEGGSNRIWISNGPSVTDWVFKLSP